ncbi:MAG TPA: S-methyl-5-thioribose kinase [Candidatus Scatomonas pullistercoris]|uniref:S-methyl-5-thioribose kinase n=1 Tax=Candidatus Scatomonas pullistercoris TaxID=2840920 RepID=A0A9D1T9I2_9FIRM|nr:S-methyl-5-thioribose kinase [Candidatus Scatomonas pullistercoris]
MASFDTYFLMKEADVIEYAQFKVPQKEWDVSTMECREIGDGNLNYVFKVKDAKGHSVIVKQAGVELRISKEMKIDTDRNRVESEILMLYGKLAPGLVPEIYNYDTVMCACCMEDLSDHEVMRTAMMEHKIFPKFADDISTYMARVLMGTTDVVMDHQEKKKLQKKFISPDLCDITEQLVYTEPYNDERGRNNVYAPNAEFVKEKLYEDEELHLEVAKLKMDFMTRAQSLIHGDLHTGSIFINEKSTIVFDPEFCMYGPMGYDIGNVVANMIFAWCSGDAAGAEEFCRWVESVIADVVNLTMEKMGKYYDEHVTDTMCKTKGFKEWYMKTILEDTSAVTGLELIRRIVGMANVKDITTIADEKARTRAERICITAAIDYIKNRAHKACGKCFLNTLKDAVKAVDQQ